MDTILIAEQDPQTRKQMKELFVLEGFQVLESQDNLSDSLSDTEPMLVVMDDSFLKNQDKGFMEALSEYPKRKETAFLLTGLWSEDEFLNLQQAQTVDFILKKPIEEEELIAVLEQVCRKRTENKETKSYLAVIEAEEQERKRLSLELHDGVCSMLAGGLMLLERTIEKYSNDDPNCLAKIQEVYGIVDQSLHELRNIMNNLSPVALKDNNLVDAIAKICHQASSISKTQFVFSHEVANCNISPLIAGTFYRVTQEITNNIIKYADASNVHVTLTGFENELLLDIIDDGVGFDMLQLKSTPTETGGRGLQNMAQRINMLNGLFQINSAPQKGTSVNVSVPLN